MKNVHQKLVSFTSIENKEQRTMNRVIIAPVRPRTILVFDVETTGLMPKSSKMGPGPPITAYPHILQLSFCIYDLWETQIVHQYDAYINVDESVEISDFISGLTGITRDICNSKGRPMLDVLRDFYDAYQGCDCIVAHNIEFDEKMILVEVERLRERLIAEAPQCLTLFNTMYEATHNIEKFCTMKKGTPICNISWDPPIQIASTSIDVPAITATATATAKTREPSKKFPKLSELHQKLFPDDVLPTNLHNSMVDVLVCLRCYLKMRHNMDTEPMV